jgi:hypothetical protein
MPQLGREILHQLTSSMRQHTPLIAMVLAFIFAK